MTEKRIAEDGEAVAIAVPITDESAARFVALIDAAPLRGVERHKDGFLSGRVRAARTGVQLYLDRELREGGSDDVVRVYRPLDEVMRVDALGSFKGKAVTDGHPSERVTAGNWGELAMGTIMGVQRDGDAVALDLVVSSQEMIDKLERGDARELSAGYTARIDWTPGKTPEGEDYDAVQRDIYIDHLAVVPAGRAGPEFRVGDDAGAWGARPLDREILEQPKKEGRHMADAHNTAVTVGDGAVTTTEAGAIRIKGVLDSLGTAQKAITDKDAEIVDLKKQVETKDGELAAAKKALEDATSPAALAGMAKERADVTAAGKAAGLADEAMGKMTDGDIRRAVVAKSLGDDAAKAMSDDAITGAFAFAKSSKSKPVGDEALGGGIHQNDADPWGFMEKKGA